MKKTATLFPPTSTPFIFHYASPRKRNPITLSPSWTFDRKARFGISNLSVQETHLRRPVSTLELLQPPKTENQPNWYSCLQSFYDLFKKQTGPRTGRNLFNCFRKWLPGTYNQFNFQTKISTTKF